MLDPAVRRQHDDYGNAPQLLSPADAAMLEAGTWFRASGECECPACAKAYYDHPRVMGALWLRRLCTGEVVKL